MQQSSSLKESFINFSESKQSSLKMLKTQEIINSLVDDWCSLSTIVLSTWWRWDQIRVFCLIDSSCWCWSWSSLIGSGLSSGQSQWHVSGDKRSICRGLLHRGDCLIGGLFYFVKFDTAEHVLEINISARHHCSVLRYQPVSLTSALWTKPHFYEYCKYWKLCWDTWRHWKSLQACAFCNCLQS